MFGNHALGAQTPEEPEIKDDELDEVKDDFGFGLGLKIGINYLADALEPESKEGDDAKEGDEAKEGEGEAKDGEGEAKEGEGEGEAKEGEGEAKEGEGEGEGAKEGEDAQGEHDMMGPDGFDPLDPNPAGKDYDWRQNRLGLPIRHPITGAYMGRAPRAPRPEREERVRPDAYQGRPERPEREARPDRAPRPEREPRIGHDGELIYPEPMVAHEDEETHDDFGDLGEDKLVFPVNFDELKGLGDHTEGEGAVQYVYDMPEFEHPDHY